MRLIIKNASWNSKRQKMNDYDKPGKERHLSCTFCGPGTWAIWEVIAEESVFFVCENHHVEMSKAEIITSKRRIGKTTWST
jgi:hypothetical protein